MPTQCLWTIDILLMFVPGALLAESPVEELPPPAAQRDLTNDALNTAESEHPEGAATVVGWGLYGPRARFYFVGQGAIADYQHNGRRYIVALAEEDPASQTKTDPNFLYFREAQTGHRWAISRQVRADGTCSVYFQLAATPGEWTLYQRSRPTWEEEPVVDQPPFHILIEPGCGH